MEHEIEGATPQDCEVHCGLTVAYYLRKDTKAGEPVFRFPRLLRASSCFCLSVSSGRPLNPEAE